MKTFSYTPTPQLDYEVRGVKRIVEACLEHSFIINQADAYSVWRHHSDDYCAGWLEMSGYTSEDIVCIAKRFCTITGQDDEHFFGW